MAFLFGTISEEEFQKKKKKGEFGNLNEFAKDMEEEEGLSYTSTLGEEETESQIKEEEKCSNGKYIRQTFLLTPEIKRALKRKAANMDIGVNTLIRQILSEQIEEKYFKTY